MMYDGLDDFQSDRCQDCATVRTGTRASRGCQYESAPAIAGRSDREYDSRLEARRLTLAISRPEIRWIGDMETGPLFDGPRQGELFS